MKRPISKTLSKPAISLALIASTFGTALHAQSGEKLDERQSAIIPIAAHAASGNIARLREELNAGLDAGVTVNEIKDILIQSYAYAGFPRALNAIETFSAVLEERDTRGIANIAGKNATAVPQDFDRTAYGNRVRNALVGADISNRTTGYAGFVPTIDTFLVEHLFADIFQRDVLNWQQRELATISMLAAMEGTDAQLKSHLTIAHRQGLSWAQLHDFAETLKKDVSPHSAQRTVNLIAELSDQAQPAGEPAQVTVMRNQKVIKGSAENFSGNVAVSSPFASDPAGNYSGALVTFEPGAHTAWHTHPLGQTLIVTSGRGLVQSEGRPVQQIAPGDVVNIPANTRHWHGATPQESMSHIAIAATVNGVSVVWQEKLTKEQYPQTVPEQPTSEKE